MTNHDDAPDTRALFEQARDDGVLSPASLQSLSVVDIGAEIQAGLGVRVDDVSASEVLLVSMMPDDSASIGAADAQEAVCAGHNLVLDALDACAQREGVLVHNRFLNGHVLYPFRPLDAAARMDRTNYRACGGTPLYDQTLVLLGTVVAKTQELNEHGVPVRTVTLLITDGEDMHSRRADESSVAAVVEDMRRAENHVIAAMGIDNGRTNFRQVFRAMGIPDEWILLPGNSAGEIRRAFQVFSQSAVRSTSGGLVSPGGF